MPLSLAAAVSGDRNGYNAATSITRLQSGQLALTRPPAVIAMVFSLSLPLFRFATFLLPNRAQR